MTKIVYEVEILQENSSPIIIMRMAESENEIKKHFKNHKINKITPLKKIQLGKVVKK